MRGTGLISSITDLYAIGEEFYIIVVSGAAISFTFLTPNLYPIFYILILLLFIQQIQKHSEIKKHHRSQMELEELKHEKELEDVKLQKLESLQLFASKVAHDIKNYLTILIGNLELLEPSKFDQQASLKNIKQATFNIQDVIQQLFDYSTHDRLNKQEIEINQLVSEVTEFILSDHGIAFNVDTYPEDIFASIDRIKIYTVVSNILINAIEAIKDYSQFDTEQDEKIRSESKTHKIDVKVDVEEVADTIFGCICIKDTGIGIRDENTEQVFEPFYTTKEGGSGLGIATAHAIIQAHNGSITLTSTYMKGTQFVIRLPIKSV